MRRAGQLSRWGVDATADPASMSDRQKHGFTTPSVLSRSVGRRQSVCQSLRSGGAFDANATTKRKADIAVGLSLSLILKPLTQAIALMRAVRRLLWRAALFLWIRPRAA